MPESRIRVVVSGTVTTQPLEPFLGSELAGLGMTASIEHAPYNQIYGTLLDPASSARQADALIVLWRMEELLGPALAEATRAPDAARSIMTAELERLAAAARQCIEQSAATLIISNPPRPMVRGLLDASHASGLAALHSECLVIWRKLAAAIPGVLFLDLDGVQRQVGDAASHDSRLLYLARMPWSQAFLGALGRLIVRVLAASRVAPRKVAVLDCDNTLWGGVVGEDGPLGVDVGEDGVGAAYRDLQGFLLALRQQGVLLALASKNNEADVWEVFDRHPGMLLRREHISAARINWSPKSQSLGEIAAELNLGLDSLVLIDDSPAECEEVRAHAREATALLLPEDPADFVGFLSSSAAFDRLSLTAEDLERPELYLQESARSALRERSASMEDYLSGLEVKVSIERVDETTVPRVAQLVNKTNQFNLTTIRRSEAEVHALSRDPASRLYAVRVRDRFGDYGLTGAIFIRTSPAAWDIDTFLLSCRVLSRGVEFGVLATICDFAARSGVHRLNARYLPTEKNAVAADFLKGAGFSTDGDVFFADVKSTPFPPPKHLTVTTLE